MKNEQLATLLQQVLNELHKTNFMFSTKNSKHVSKASSMLNNLISHLWLKVSNDDRNKGNFKFK